ncbi:alpha/beta hydrolase [Candidatus Woesearchaeota archaeon]|nr:alpha/beta hydrolase [Candidatus Woesearchaeota archaeon]
MRGRFLQMRDATLYYERTKGNPTLVFLHGATLNHTVFDYARHYFIRKGYGTLAIDMRGHGLSTAFNEPEKYTLPSYVRDLESIIDHEKVKGHVLVGYSAGSMVAQQYAYENPDNVRGQVFVAGMYDFKKAFVRDPLRRALYMGREFLFWVVAQYNQLVSTGTRYYPNYCGRPFPSLCPASFVAMAVRHTPPDAVKTYRVFGDAFLEWNTEPVLSHLRKPTLILAAEHDVLIPLPTAYELAGKLPLPTTPRVIAGANHGLVFTHPRQVNLALKHYLTTL